MSQSLLDQWSDDRVCLSVETGLGTGKRLLNKGFGKAFQSK